MDVRDELDSLSMQTNVGQDIVRKSVLLIDTLRATVKDQSSKLDAQEKAGKMLAEGVADSLKLLRAIQKDLWDRAEIDRREGGVKVVNLSNSTWRKLCEAVGEPE